MKIITETKTKIFNEKLEVKLLEIKNVLKEKYILEKNVGVLEGLSGIALFQFYYAKYKNNDEFADRGQVILEKIIETINQGYNYPTFSLGIAGAGWVLDHLKNKEFIDSDNDELLSNVDEYLYKTMIRDIDQGYYDFLHGSMGYAFYFLNRYRSTHNMQLKHKYKGYLVEFLDELSEIAINDKNGIKWLSTINAVDTTKLDGYNLSLSHGISSIISFLSKLNMEKEFKEKYKGLLIKAVRYLENTELQNVESTSLYPCWILKDGEKDKNSRLAWCYGDFGVGLALLKASKALNDNKLKKKALFILESTTKRTSQSNTKIIDAGICHGAFGNVQIYNYLYHETKNQIYRDAATYWIKNGLAMSTNRDGFAGFKQWFGNPNDWKPKTSLLEGVAGIGLSMIDYLSKEQNFWDESLLIS